MGISQVLMVVVVLLGLVAYWWFTQGRHGARAAHVHLGLHDGEEIRHTFTAFFKLNFGVKDIGLAAAGLQRKPKAVTLTLTDGGVLVFLIQGEDPRRYQAGQFRLTRLKENDGKLVGAAHTMEAADVYQVDAEGTEPFQLRLARSAADVLVNWSNA